MSQKEYAKKLMFDMNEEDLATTKLISQKEREEER